MALQATVQRLGKPWYRRRALRLFRDDTSLSATPQLWPAIESALTKSRFLILLASPEAAVSHWVGREVAYWLDHAGAGTILIALTEGELAWDVASSDFLWSQSTPLPAMLKSRFSTEPRWIDLRRYRESGTAKGPDFMELGADFAAAIHGTAKEDLLSQEVRQQRRALTLAWSAAALLLVLAVAAAGFAAYGFDRALEAVRQRDAATTRLAEAQLSQSRFLADAARQENEIGDHATALALALEALPDPSRGVNRPYVAEAEKELFAAQNDLREVAELRDQLDRVNSVAFSPDGKRFVTTSDYNVALIWSSSGEKFIPLTGHTRPVRFGSFSSDGSLVVTGSEDTTARVWDATSGKELFVLGGHASPVNSVGFSTDGKRIVTASGDGTARVWDLTTRKTIQVLRHADTAMPFTPEAVMSAALSPDGSMIVTAGADEKVFLWDSRSGRKIAGLAGHTGPVLCATFSLDGKRVATASADRKVRLFDVAPGGTPILYPYLVISGHEDAVGSVAFFPDGRRIATGSKDGSARVWDAGTGALLFILRAGGSPVSSVAVSPDGARVITASRDNRVKIWDATEDLTTRLLDGHDGNLNTAAFSPNSSFVVTSSDDATARIWDTVTGAVHAVLQGHTGIVSSATFSPDGASILTVSDDNTAIVWDVASGRRQFTLGDRERPVTLAVFSPDGTRILTTSRDNSARFWASATGQPEAEVSWRTGKATSVALSANGKRLVIVSDDQTARVWDLGTRDTGDSGHVLAELHGPFQAATFSPDTNGVLVLTTSKDNTAALWNAATGALQSVLHGHEDVINTAVFSHSGRLIATASDDGTARIWSSESGGQLLRLPHEGKVKSITFFADDKRVLTGSWDKTARVWSADNGALLGVLHGHEESVGPLNGIDYQLGGAGLMRDAVISPDGTRAAILYVAGWVGRVWTVFPSTQALVDSARSRMPCSLTSDQRRHFFLD